MFVFQALLDSAQLQDPLRCGTECITAECGARHHTGRCGPGCAGPCAGCGTAGPGPSPVDPGNHSPAITQVFGMGLCPCLASGCWLPVSAWGWGSSARACSGLFCPHCTGQAPGEPRCRVLLTCQRTPSLPHACWHDRVSKLNSLQS